MKTKIEHYLTLFKDCDEYIVDLREDTIDENDDPIYEEYIEGFIFEKYDEALAKYHELEEKYRDTKGGVLVEREDETKDERIRRGFIVETNVSKCSCEHKEKHCLIPDDVCLDSFQVWTEDYDHYIDDGKNGNCRVCGDFVTFHWHYVVTHREEKTE
tara:strand:- start:67 stop:537 length:471 start_codon:yes stop_codon:yes gene_type:complete